PSPNSDFVAVGAGSVHSLGLKADGTIDACGAGQPGQSGWPHYSQCDVPSPNSDFVAVGAGSLHSLGLRGVTSQDCNFDGLPDECELAGNDCNSNGIPDDCDMARCAGDLACADCNTNGGPDECDIANGTSGDCQGDGIPDDCQLSGNDCNTNGVPDECDIANGTSGDCQGDGIPDDCQLSGNDCNSNGVPDDCDISMVLDVGDLVVGGNGLGTGESGAGVSVRDGLLYGAGVSAGAGMSSDPFIPTAGTNGAADLPFVDGVLSPDGNTPIDSGGSTNGFPDTDGNSYDAVRNGAAWAGMPITVADQPGVPRAGVGIHANAGITFDLAAIRAAYPGRSIERFEAVAGLLDPAIPEADVRLWVLVDGVVRYDGTFIYGGTTCESVTIFLTANSGFLTLASTDVDVNYNGDQAVFADARLVLSTASYDCNTNGVPDECDSIAPGDFDGDGFVTLADYMWFADCTAGPNTPPAVPMPACAPAYLTAFDMDNDNDVDLADFAAFQEAFSG
ncbi:MAG: hypothetical protein GY842_16650, partial [bacterium]|nr:hypothetical protein [bacterium]